MKYILLMGFVLDTHLSLNNDNSFSTALTSQPVIRKITRGNAKSELFHDIQEQYFEVRFAKQLIMHLLTDLLF